jgi:lysophospholipase L1-like esterase
VTFGDSHVDFGIRGDNGVDVSYISQDLLQLGVKSVHSPYSLAGKLRALSDKNLKIEAINHGIGGTSSDATYRGDGEPNALAVWNGITRFEAEVLGKGGTAWDAGTGKHRDYAYQPTKDDFVYVSVGTMDPPLYIDSSATHANIRRMIGYWKNAGLPATHFILATITPNEHLKRDFPGKIPALNQVIMQVAAEEGVTLVDVAAKVSNGEDWLPGTSGDGLHPNEAIHNWLAQEILNKVTELRKIENVK